jgi:hypothetical protein
MKNPEALTFRISKGLSRPVAGKLYLISENLSNFSSHFFGFYLAPEI